MELDMTALMGDSAPESGTFPNGITWLDADTVEQDGQRYRIQGLDAPEIGKLIDGRWQQGTAGGQAYLEAIPELAKKMGFTEIRVAEGAQSTHGRLEADLINPETGESFKNAALSAGIFEPTRYTNQEDNLAARLAESQRERDTLAGIPQNSEWDQAREGLMNAAAAEGAKQAGFRQIALNEAELAAAKAGGYADQYAFNTVATRDFGRDLDNKSNNPLSTALDVGLEGAIEGLYGFGELVGDSTDWEWASQAGRAGQRRAQNRMGEMGSIITSYKDVDGIFGKDGAMQYVINNAAMSLPYMVVTTAGALAAPVTGGLSMTAPAALYAGQTYAEMEGDNKNAAIALASGTAQAVLDRLGLSLILPKGTGLVSKSVRKTITDQLVSTGKAATTAEAKAMLAGATRKTMAELSGDAVKFAKQQIAARNVARAGILKAMQGAAGESITEAMQEAIGYTAAHHANNFQDWDANAFVDRITQAMVAGASLGGTFAVPGTAIDAGQWADVAYRGAPSDSRNRAQAANFADKDIARFGSQVNVQDFNESSTAQAIADRDVVEDVSTRTARFNRSKQNRTIRQEGRALLEAIPGLWRGLTRHAFGGDLQDRSDTARWMGESFGSALQRSTSGATYENRKHHMVTQYKNMLEGTRTVVQKFTGNKATQKNRLQFSDDFYSSYQQALAKAKAEGRDINWATDLEGTPMANRQADFRAFMAQLNTLGNKMHADQAKHNPELGYIPDYLMKYKAFDKVAIERNRGQFEAALMQEFPNMPPAEAKKLTDAVLNMDGVSDIDDALTVIKSAAASRPGAHKQRALGLSEKEAFAPFMKNDLFDNVSSAAKSATRYTTYQEYIGENNSKLNSHLNKIEQELIASGMGPNEAQARVDKLAADMTDYIDAESGNYKRIENKFLEGVQKNLLFVTTLTSLPLATISNFVEIGMQVRGLTANQVFGKDGSLRSIGETFAKQMKTQMTHEGNAIIEERQRTGGHAVAKDLGFFEWEVGAAHTTGVTETGHWRQQALDKFFRWNQLQGWTDFSRAARAGIAGDYIVNHVTTILNNQNQDVETRDVYEAKEALRNLGIDPDFMVNFFQTLEPTPEQEARWDDYMRDGAFNFVNEAIALPQSANRPKIFQDPRFAMFTQFQGFISTFTANHLPRLWGEYVKRGTPAMKYNAFGMMTMMIALGFASQWLKDRIKYNEDSPYIKGGDYIRRGIGASGLLGTGERVIDFVFPVYEERYYNPIDWAFGTITGESAAIGKVVRAGSIGGKVLTGEKDPTELAKLSPFTVALKSLGDSASDWNWR